MEFKPYVWTTDSITHGLNTTYVVVGPLEVLPQKPKLALIQGGRAWLGREDSLLRARRTVEKEETNDK